ncbi:hypothetical protein BH10PSE7_BH10PSE7_44590 [soil metagenome]
MASITKAYDSHAQARAAVTALEEAGVSSGDISIVANRSVDPRYDDDGSETAAGAGIGAVLGGGAGLLAGLGLLAIPGLGPVVAAGWLAATAAGAVAGGATGGIVGALVDAGTSKEDAHVYSEAVRRGATLVTVKTDGGNEDVVHAILDEEEPIDPAERRREYASTGWREFDPAAVDYKPTEIEAERMRRL